MEAKKLHSKADLFKLGGEISYRKDANVAKFLLGGLGTGNISVGARGELRDWEIFNWPGKGQFVPFSFFSIWTKEEGKEPVSRILESKICPPYYKSHGFLNGELAGIPRFEDSKMVGKQPFVYVDLEDSKVPVTVQMEAYTPFIPLNADDSGIPAAIIKYRVKNPTDKPIDVAVCGTMANVVGFDGYDVFNNVKLVDEVKNEYRESEGLRVLYYTAKHLKETDMKFGSMSISTTNANQVTAKKWLHGQWTDNAQDFWDDFSSDGKLTQEEDIEAKGCDLLEHYDFSFLNLKERISSISSQERIEPNTGKVFEFIITWYFPNRPKGWIEYDADLERYRNNGYDTIKNYYATKFADAWSVADYIIQKKDYLETNSHAFEDALYHTSLPVYVIDAVASNIMSMKSHCCFRIENGNFLGWEGIRDYVGCGQGNVNHVWNYATAVAALFPELEITMRNVEFNIELDEDGGMPFRARKCLGESRWDMIPACDGQFGSILRIYREWKYTGDDGFLNGIWDNMMKALEYAIAEWDTDGDGVLDGKMHVTYDIEFYGPNTMTNSIYLGAIKGVAEMAAHLGKKDVAEKYGALYQKAEKAVDEQLFNGKYYIQKLDDVDEYRYQYGKGCLTDQLLGQFMAHAAGLGYVLPKEHVKKALESIYEYNFRDCMDDVPNVQRTYALNDEAGLVLCSWPDGGRPRFPFAYCDEVWTGVEYQVACCMVKEGMLEEAFTIIRAIRDRYDGYKRCPWSETEAGHHYIRPMASFSLIPFLSGYQCDLVKKEMSFAPVLNENDYSTFWINGKAWGTYHQYIDADGKMQKEMKVLYGDLKDITVID
ncbi:MAG: non-lysosomal glucosylceramidase [Lachnospiraceae bacterium]|nr:non-lysosomal glucosylceramidase [Lachnospiraceae bacterium]